MIERFLKIHFLIKFLVSGGTATAVNLVALYVLTDFFGLWYLISAVIAFVIAFFVSFTLQKFWTFIDHRTDVLPAQASLYIVVQVWDLCLNTAGLYMLVTHFHLWYIAAQFVMSFFIAIQNLLLYRAFIFTQKKETEYEI
jgi:putative flippase GtrA